MSGGKAEDRDNSVNVVVGKRGSIFGGDAEGELGGGADRGGEKETDGTDTVKDN